jgi:hypothetical protein
MGANASRGFASASTLATITRRSAAEHGRNATAI